MRRRWTPSGSPRRASGSAACNRAMAPLSAERISSAAGYFGLIAGIATVAGLSACAVFEHPCHYPVEEKSEDFARRFSPGAGP